MQVGSRESGVGSQGVWSDGWGLALFGTPTAGESGVTADFDSLGCSAASVSEPSVTPGLLSAHYPPQSSISRGDRELDFTGARKAFEVATRFELEGKNGVTLL